MKSWIKINDKDNVAVALQDLSEGCEIDTGTEQLFLLQAINKGHKFALSNLENGQHLYKYGEQFGHAITDITAGEWVHEHNAKTNLKDNNEYDYSPITPISLPAGLDKEVNIYRRKNGDVAVRNELWIIPTVGCVNGISQQLKEKFIAENDVSSIDGVHVFTHQFGCSQLGDDHKMTKQLLQSMTKHPNAGGVLVIGLGCENNQVTPFMEELGDYDKARTHFMVAQSSENEIETGLVHLKALLSNMQHDKREAGKLSELKFGLECGGSDGLSGITANPLLGLFSDSVITNGGTTVLTEVPEMFGAETILMSRATNEDVFNKIVKMINGFKDYYAKHDLPIYENPSPGNKAGGITTLEDKSLGCTQKAGASTVVDVIEYTQRLKKPGLNLLNAPGNDAIATSALAAAGCHLVLFSTGRGTPYGGFVPTVKIATNTELATRKKHWIDFDAGVLVSSDINIQVLLESFLSKIASIASGELAKNEVNNIRELAIWKNGVTL